MQELLLLRHAESDPAGLGQADIDRSITAYGETQAHAVGQWLLSHDVVPDAIFCSPAVRTRMTSLQVLAALEPIKVPVAHVDGIYEATPGELLAILSEHDASEVKRPLLVGHNPGLEQLLALLCQGRSGGFRGMSSASLAHVRLDGVLEPGHGKLLAFHTA